MTSIVPRPVSAAPAAPPVLSYGPPRLLAGLTPGSFPGGGRLDRVGHLTVHGTLPRLDAWELVDLAENTALHGRGGAHFPVAYKLRAVIEAAARGGRARTAVVVNGTEGEPSCLKDTALLLRAPHLVLDGAELAVDALGAERLCVGVTRKDVAASVRAAVAERGPRRPVAEVRQLPERFVTGESSALVSGLGQGPALPTGSRIRTSDSGLDGLPTLLSNAETFAQLAVAGRLGALGFRDVGLPDEPGTVLLTVAGSHVLEVPTGVPLPYVLGLCGSHPGQGVLVGGYHGRWLDPRSAWQARIADASLEGLGSRLGAGAVLPLPVETCPVGETLQVVRWLAAESAGQCGPCVIGLPALADELERAAAGPRGQPGAGAAALRGLRARTEAVKKRGACSHPDGTAGFVESALDVFATDFRRHAEGDGCGRPVLGALPVPVQESRAPGSRALGPGAPGDDRRTDLRLVVDWVRCQGHGLCAGAAPDLVELSGDGYPTRADYGVPQRLGRQATRAVRRCPALALRVEK
ncbi:NADH-ubiquinone oxidoreductase-F iron-sulfur binding region domain-containing protein [Streptomyces boninensis]|uniref:NADH-ubiquinone oxidoreductase-F iron-sulfur binding region domain-containing protein n=1 Tax=Streptomyces boninensis TaxID=2039455 RepID=UPI003B227647